MTGNDVFTQLLEQFDRPVAEHDLAAMRAAELLDEVINRNARLTNEQCDILDHRIFQSMGENYNDSLVTISLYILLSANKGRWDDIIFSNGPFEEKVLRNYLTEDYFINILKREGVLAADEQPLYWEYILMHLGNRLSSRYGHTTFTNRHLVIRGPFSGVSMGGNPINRLYYDRIEWKPYLENLDILDYDRMSNLNMKWSLFSKKIEFRYKTRFLEAKERVVYGPLFFKAQLPVSVKLKEGSLLVEIMFISDAPEGRKPSEFRKERAVQFFGRLKQCCGLKVSE